MRPDADHLDLTYVLSRYPQRISTFVNGEIAEVSRRCGRVSVLGVRRTDEPDNRPGGIPDDVDVRWLPLRHDPHFWRLFGAGLIGAPMRAVRELRMASEPVRGLRTRARWAHLAAAAVAEAGRLPLRPRRERHLHAHFAADGAVAAHVIGGMRGIPYSVTVHGSADLFRENAHLDRLLRDAALVVGVSDLHRRTVLERVRGLAPDRVEVIGVGVPTSALAALARATPPDREGPPRIVSVANLGPTKGMPVLVDAVGRLVADGRDVVLDIVGDGPERTAIERRIAAHGLEDRVRLLGAVPPAEAHAIMAGASCFALACVVAPNGARDGLPTVLMEAMAMGVPSVSTTVSAIPELIEDGVTGRLVPPHEPERLAGAIADLLDDPRRARELAAAGRRRVRDRHDQAKNAARLLDAILARRV